MITYAPIRLPISEASSRGSAAAKLSAHSSNSSGVSRRRGSASAKRDSISRRRSASLPHERPTSAVLAAGDSCSSASARINFSRCHLCESIIFSRPLFLNGILKYCRKAAEQCSTVARQFPPKPYLGGRPFSFDRRGRNFHRRSDFCYRHTTEKAQFDDLPLPPIQRLKVPQRGIQGSHINFSLVIEFKRPLYWICTAALLSLSSNSIVRQSLAHNPRKDAKEVSTVSPRG